MHDNKVCGLVKKYGSVDEFSVPDDVREFSGCKMFQKDAESKPEDPSGPVVVCDDGEELELSDD